MSFTLFLALACPSASVAQVVSYAFVPNYGSNNVTVIDTAARAVVGTVPAGTNAIGAGVTPDGRLAYIVNRGTSYVTVIDVVSRTVVGSIPVGLSPLSVAVAPDGQKVYVTNSGGNAVQVIDVATNTAGLPITGPGLADARMIAITPDGQTAYVATASSVVPIDLATRTPGTPIASPYPLLGLAISPDGQTAIATAHLDNRVLVIDLALQAVTGAPIAVSSPIVPAISPDSQFAYVPNSNSNTVSVINLATHAVVATPTVGLVASSVAFTPDGLHAFVLSATHNNVTVIDAATHTPSGSPIPVGTQPYCYGQFFTPQIIVPAGGPLIIANDAALTASAFKSFVPFHGGTVQLTGHWTTARHLSMLAGGGTIDTNGFNATVAGTVINSGQLTKTGAGTLTLSGGSLHTGGTVVSAGTLVVNGVHSSGLTVTGGTLRGNGTLGHVTVGNATFAPGDGIGLMSAGDITLSAGATFEVELNGTTAGTGYDSVSNTGAAQINGAQLVVLPSFTPPSGARFTILQNATGTFHDRPEGSVFQAGGRAFRITYAGGDGDDVELIHNTPPAVLGLGPRSIDEDAGLVSIPFDVFDDVTTDPSALLSVSVVSMNQALLPDANISIAGLGASRFLELTTLPNVSGAAEIRLTATDDLGATTVTFMLTVSPVNDAPTISPVAPQSVPENMPLDPVTFTVDDVDNDVANLTVTATSSNQTLAPNANLVVGGSGATRTIAVTPGIGEHGQAEITLTVSDGSRTSSTTFLLTVTERTYYLAEGATGAFFDTDILIANPNDAAAPIVVTFLKDDGTSIVQTRTLPATSRTTIRVDEIVGLESTNVSTIVTSTEALPIVVERTMRWDASGYGAHTEKATAGAAPAWTFAEGAQGFFSTYFLLTNPQGAANTAHVSYLRENAPAVLREYPLAAGSRMTIDAGAEPELREQAFGAVISFARPGVAERAMYFGTDPVWLGGHAAAGATSSSTSWFLAEGATGAYFTTFLLLVNPADAPAVVTLTYLPDTGVPVTKTYTIPAGQRLTRNIALEDPSLANAAVATRVESTRPIVVERAQYWGQPTWLDAHVSLGVTAPGERWGLAEGRVGGPDDAQTYILLANPGAEAATVTITFLRADGGTVVNPFTVPPTSRFNVAVVPGAGSMAPELADESFGARIVSTHPIVVERSLYSNANGITWAAGTNAIATRLP